MYSNTLSSSMSGLAHTQCIQLGTFEESDLWALRANLTQPVHPAMIWMGKITLMELSPFKLSRLPTLSLTEFMGYTWSEEEEEIDATRVQAPLEELNALLSNSGKAATIDEACGFITVIGTYAAGIRAKLNNLASPTQGSIGHSHVNRGEYASSIENGDGTLHERVIAWRNVVIDRLLQTSTDHPEDASRPNIVEFASWHFAQLF